MLPYRFKISLICTPAKVSYFLLFKILKGDFLSYFQSFDICDVLILGSTGVSLNTPRQLLVDDKRPDMTEILLTGT